MATHQQITQNYSDVNGAWGQLQYLVSQYLPQTQKHIYDWAALMRQRRRYT